MENMLYTFIKGTKPSYGAYLKTTNKQKADFFESTKDMFKDKDWERLYMPIYRFFRWRIWTPVRYDFNYFLQRHIKGWSIDESWSLYSHICYRYIKPLKHMRANLHGYPYQIGMKGWKLVIDQIIWSFESVIREDFFKPGSEEGKKQQKGFELFGKYFMNLWD